MKICMELFNNNNIFLICHPLQVIFIHYKSRIATTIRRLYRVKIAKVNSGLHCLKISRGSLDMGDS